MVDAHGVGACGLGRAGSTPVSPTIVVGADTTATKNDAIASISVP